ncbi:MAG: thiamine phosphate synthase [Acidiferrobacterales bacterium]|nr:thiamine phosphate synthase [Acidiferrobacterales bacterium]
MTDQLTLRLAGLYAVADTECIGPTRLIEAVTTAIDGGAAVVQYRDKSGNDNVREKQAAALADLCERRGTVFIVNDDVELARHVGATGVHLGRDDPPLADARRVLGSRSIIGVSCYNELERALAAANAGADYVAFGSFYPSSTKPAAVHATVGLLREARERLHIPIVAIGGITPENGGALVAAGANALAVIQGLFAHGDIREAARRYVALFAAPNLKGGP